MALKEQSAQLTEQIVVGGRAGAAAMAMKAALDSRLRALMQKAAATGGSIYVPVRSPKGDAQGLAFLCIEPFRFETQQLRTKLIPLRSVAGRCFDKGLNFISSDASRDPDHYQAAATIAGYQPATMLNLALAHDGKTLGVLQLLRREGEVSFTEADLTTAQAMLDDIGLRVDEIVRIPDFLQVLGVGRGERRRTGRCCCSTCPWLVHPVRGTVPRLRPATAQRVPRGHVRDRHEGGRYGGELHG